VHFQNLINLFLSANLQGRRVLTIKQEEILSLN
jgi:hypothetical protein